VVAGDFNADGRLDLAVADLEGFVGVLLGNEGGFSSPVTYKSGGSYSSALTLGDFNSDGRLDLAVVNSAGRNIGVLMGNGSGAFAAPITYVPSGLNSEYSQSLVAGDFNADGRLDLAFGDFSYGVGVLLNCDRGGFAAGTTWFSGQLEPKLMKAGDFNADGLLDLAVTHESDESIAILVNRSGGKFDAPVMSYPDLSELDALAAGDFNGDGRLDLAAIYGLLLGDGSGGLSPAVPYDAGDWEPQLLEPGDFNADGRLDLAVAYAYGNGLGVLLGDGCGGFAAPVTCDIDYWTPESLAAADFNADGRLDLAVVIGPDVGVLLGLGNGQLDAPLTYASGSWSVGSLTVGDFNTDGCLDLAMVCDEGISVLLGDGRGGFAPALIGPSGTSHPSFLTSGDFNGDGRRDLVLVEEWYSEKLNILLGSGNGRFAMAASCTTGRSYPSSVTAGDFNADGHPDVAVVNEVEGIALLLSAGGDRPAVRGFESPHAIRFDVQTRRIGAGQLVETTRGALDGIGRLEVAGQMFAPTSTDDFLTDGDRTVVTPTGLIAGLYVGREVTVPATGNEDFARTIEVLTNPTDRPITTTVRIVGNLGSDGNTTVWATSDGDSLVEPTDQWIGTDDADGIGSPAIVHYLHGPRGLQPTMVRLVGDRGDNIEWTYDVTVPACRTVRLAHFTIMADTRAEAEAAAAVLVTADAFGGQAGAFLTQAELYSLANFRFALPSPGRPDLADADDTGESNGDNITRRNNSGNVLHFDVPGTIEGATVTICADGTAIGSGTGNGGTLTVTTNGSTALVDGSHTITARQAEPGAPESPDSSDLTIYIDTAAPTASVPDLNPASDTGLYADDNLTQGVAVQVDGTAGDPLSAGYASGLWKVDVTADDATTGSDAADPFYSIVLATMAEGDRSITATVYDRAGNSYTTAALLVTVDRTAPEITVAPMASADRRPRLTGSVDAPAAGLSGFSVTVHGTTYHWPASVNLLGTVWTLPDDTIASALVAGTYDVAVAATDLAGNTGFDGTTGELTVYSSIAGRHIFYNDSAWDGHNGLLNGDPAANAFDDNALATDKVALLPGGTGSLVNYTSYLKGLNGIMIDVDGLPGTVAAADFRFLVGNSNNFGLWTSAPEPDSVSVRPGGGVGGSDRITVTWANNAIRNRWVQVTVLAANTGLAREDVHYWGNQVAETGNNPANARVDAGDASAVRAHYSSLGTVAVSSLYDINRDKRVDAGDFSAVRSNYTGLGPSLVYLAAPSPSPGALNARHLASIYRLMAKSYLTGAGRVLSQERSLTKALVDAAASHEDLGAIASQGSLPRVSSPMAAHVEEELLDLLARIQRRRSR